MPSTKWGNLRLAIIANSRFHPTDRETRFRRSRSSHRFPCCCRYPDTMIVIRSPRLQLSQFQMMDAQEVFGCITRGITKFMPWEAPSWMDYVTRCEKRIQAPEPNKFHFVIRRLDIGECVGMASLEDADSASPEIGLWLKESVHGQGFGGEVVASLIEWGHLSLGKGSFTYPVAVQNIASRRIAENLHGETIGNRTTQSMTRSFTESLSTNRHLLHRSRLSSYSKPQKPPLTQTSVGTKSPTRVTRPS